MGVAITTRFRLHELVHIARNLRARDREELFATRWDDDPLLLADQYARVEGLRYLFSLDEEPVAVMGAIEQWPGTWSVYAFGTDKWDRVVFSLTKTAKRVMIPEMQCRGMRRAHAASLDVHVQAHRWMERLGGKKESTMPGFGRNGETFFMFVLFGAPENKE